MQCAEFASLLPRAIEEGFSPQLVIVSPLQRTLQTAEYCLDALPISQAPWVAIEHARETIGNHTCDMRRTITPDIEARHPRVQFHTLLEREDTQWTEMRETEEAQLLRGARLLDFIYSLPEERIMLVCHAEMISVISKLVGKPISDFNGITKVPPQQTSHSSHSIHDVWNVYESDGAMEVEGVQLNNCQIVSFLVAQLPHTAVTNKK